MKKNNFQQLEEQMEEKYHNTSDAIKKNVVSRKGTWDFIGYLFELYIPQIFSTLIGTNANMKNELKSEKNKKITD